MKIKIISFLLIFGLLVNCSSTKQVQAVNKVLAIENKNSSSIKPIQNSKEGIAKFSFPQIEMAQDISHLIFYGVTYEDYKQQKEYDEKYQKEKEKENNVFNQAERAEPGLGKFLAVCMILIAIAVISTPVP